MTHDHTTSAAGHVPGDTHQPYARSGPFSRQTRTGAAPKPQASGATNLRHGQERRDPQSATAVSDSSPTTDHASRDPQSSTDGGGDLHPGSSQLASETQWRIAAAGDDHYLLLTILADQVDDLESSRIAMENRLRSLTSDEEWGKGLTVDRDPILKRVQQHYDDLRKLEARTVSTLERAMAAHPLGPWVDATPGIGLKTTARFLGTVGNLAHRDKPSQLWAYCGLHVVNGRAPARRKAEQGNWNDEARKRIWLVAQGPIKATGDGPGDRSPYRDVYEDARAKYADATHSRPCKRCGPSGSPAAAGSDLSDGHKHARAVRIVMKQIILDMWRAATCA